MQEVLHEDLDNGIRLTIISTDKFRASVMRLGFLTPCGADYASEYAALPHVLRRGTAAYPDMLSLAGVTDMLYGARVEPSIRKRGENLILGFLADVIDEKYTWDSDSITEHAAALLTSFWTTPKLCDAGFDPAYVEAEGANLADRIAAQRNNPRSWVTRRMQEIMCMEERYGQNELGTQAGAYGLTPETLYSAYQTLITQAPIELFYCGSMPPTRVKEAFATALSGFHRTPCPLPPTEILSAPKHDVRTVVEEMQVKQGKLAIGFRTGITGADPDYPALLIMNHIFGGSTGSRLFREVREKRSLCYYASSSISQHKGILVVTSGIENENFDVARSEILHQLADIQNGHLAEEELENALLTLQNSLRETQDSPLRLENYWLGQTIQNQCITPEHLSEQLEAVTREDIVSAANRVKLDTIFFLKGAAQ